MKLTRIWLHVFVASYCVASLAGSALTLAVLALNRRGRTSC